MIPRYDRLFVNQNKPCFCPHEHGRDLHPDSQNIVAKQIEQGRLSWRIANICCRLGLTAGLHLFCGMVDQQFQAMEAEPCDDSS